MTPAERSTLLTLARRALEARVRRQPSPLVPKGEAFDLPAGAFVTLHRHGELRGCLGRLDTDRALGSTVAELAAVVSDSDPRFDAVQPSELDDIDIEISVLTPEQPIASIDEVDVGRHGLIAQQGYRRGLLLPQVAVEHGWDRETFVRQTCVKAGLPPDAWRHGAELFVFEAEVFGEEHELH